MSFQDILFGSQKAEKSESAALEHGNHGINVLDIVRITEGAVTPHSANASTFENVALAPAVISAAPCSQAEADEAEDFASRTEADVKNGVRKLKAAARVRMSEAELQTGMRAYQAVDSNAALLKAKSNGKLASHLLNQRKDWAQLGYGLDRGIKVTDRQVSEVRYRYLGA